jgi:hypothetical protein
MKVWWSWGMTSLRYGAWAPVLVFVFHVVVAECFDIYRVFPDFDMPMHFIGGFARGCPCRS